MKTLGNRVIKFIERYCVHSAGDYLGQPFILREWQKEIIRELFEVRDDGSFKHHTAYISLPKANGKTELAGALAVYGLLGSGNPAPLIPVVASSYDQADLVFGSAKAMISNGELRHFVDLQDRKIVVKDNPTAHILRVPCIAGGNDGLRPSPFAVFDEIHEMTGKKEKAHLVIQNGLRKRANTIGINITTAGVENSLAYRLYKYGKSIQAGEIEDGGFYFKCYEADPELDIHDFDQRQQALEQSNPALDDWIDREQLERAFQQIPENEFRRYFLNQWTTTAERWLPAGTWEECVEEKKIEKGSKIILAFDGSYSRDSTALVGISMEERPHIEVLGHWERPLSENNLWKVPRSEVLGRIGQIFQEYEVVQFVVDPMGWHQELDELEDKYGSEMILYFEGNYRKKMAEACSRFYSAVMEKGLSHDGDFNLFQHLINCVPKETPQGTLVTKINKASARKIDLAIASIMAFDRWSDLIRPEEVPDQKSPEFISL